MRVGASRIAVYFLAVYILADYSLARGVPFWAASYAVLVGSSLLLLATDIQSVAGVVARSPTIRIGLLLWAMWFLAVLSQPVLYMGYVIGDAATIMLPLIYLALGFICPDLFLLQRNRRVLYSAIILGSIAAPFVAIGIFGRNFDPPHYFLFSALWVALFRSKSRLVGGIIIAAAIAGIGLALGSGQRTGVIFGALCVSIVIWLKLRARGMSLLVVSTGAIVAIALLVALPLAYIVSNQSLGGAAAEAVLAESRMQKIGTEDASILVRFREGQDVLHQHRVRASPWQRLLGHGHGAYYIPKASYVSRNVTEEGYVHNIHFGPLLVLHRYGYLGLALVAFIIVLLTKDLVSRDPWWAESGSIRPESVFLVAVIVGLINFLFRNSLTDPVFSYSLAGWLYCRQIYRSPGVIPVAAATLGEVGKTRAGRVAAPQS